MLENANQEVMREIGRKTFKIHWQRNAMAILAIALTTLLITMIFTVGISFLDTIKRGTEIAPGPLADGGVVAPLPVYEKIQNMEQVEWAAYVRPCNLGSLHNQEMIGINAVLLAPNQEFYARNNVEIVSGTFPKSADEIIISNTMAKRLGMGEETGGNYILRPVILEAGKQVEKEISVIITGIYTSPIEPLAPIYEEIYTAESFLETYAPQMQEKAATIYIRFKDMEDDRFVGNYLEEIRENVGGEGIKYIIPQSFPILYYLLLAMLLALIMFCGYLLIYNVFYIFIANDIRFYGLLKTIGTSTRQIKTLLIWQTVRLGAAGIAIGLVLGYCVGILTVPVVLSFTSFGDFFRPSASPSIFLFATFFSIITVMISCRKPYHIAMHISPVEASKYEGKNRKRKKILTILSFSLSSVIFLVVFTATLGYDVETMVERYNTADVRIRQQAMIYGSEEKYIPISKEMITELKELPFVRDVILYYETRKLNSSDYGCESGMGQIKMVDALKKDYERCIEQGFGWMQPGENGDIRLRIQGFPSSGLNLEEPNIKVLDGSLDETLFASGGYLIFNQGTRKTGQLTPDGVRAGDLLSLSFYDMDRQQYVEKDFEVLAVVEKVNPFPTGILSDAPISLCDTDFKEIYPLADDMINIVQMNADQELTESQYKLVERTIQSSYNSQLSIRSRFIDREEFRTSKNAMTFVGLFISGIFGLIGLCNIVNTLATDILSRKMEYAAMQSIGMTKRQMMKNIQRESMLLCGIGIAFAIPVGIVLTHNITALLFSLSGFSMPFFIIGCMLLLGTMFGISVSIAFILTNYLNRKTVVERLCEAE